MFGYAGKFLWIDLTKGTIREEIPSEDLLREYIGGYGVGAKVLYDHMEAGVDPLGPENILGVLTGPLTGSSAPTATRWTVVAKSPLTGGWGDANGSGYFGVSMKKAGVDAIFFTGISKNPVYLFLDEDFAELRDASSLWGKDTYEIEDWIKAELGKDVEGACIGPAGEKLSLISGVIHSKGRAAARSGLGAVMGSKRLKLIAARGNKKFPVGNLEKEKEFRKKYMKEINDGVGASNFYRETGTPGILTWAIQMADAPMKNWEESSINFPDTEPLEFSELKKHRQKRKACEKCGIACWGTSVVEYDGKQIEAHQPEYQTSAAFGSLTVNNNYPSLITANEVCNRLGLDTISAGGCVAFAIECYQNGLISKEDTGDIELDWGDHKSMILFLEKIGLREDFGDTLALGVKKASEILGKGSEEFAIHVGGQELPMHDPRFEPGLGLVYKLEATPGRHTQASQYTVPPGLETERPAYGDKRSEQKGRGHFYKEASVSTHTMNASGMCLFGFASTHITFIPEYLSAVRGEDFTVKDMMLCGERISNIRQAFNVREGINAVSMPVPNRPYGRPPFEEGPTGGIEVEIDEMTSEYLTDMGWTSDAAIPTRQVLEKLGLHSVADDLWASNEKGMD